MAPATAPDAQSACRKQSEGARGTSKEGQQGAVHRFLRLKPAVPAELGLTARQPPLFLAQFRPQYRTRQGPIKTHRRHDGPCRRAGDGAGGAAGHLHGRPGGWVPGPRLSVAACGPSAGGPGRSAARPPHPPARPPVCWRCRAEVTDTLPPGWHPPGKAYKVALSPQEEEEDTEYPRASGRRGQRGGSSSQGSRRHVCCSMPVAGHPPALGTASWDAHAAGRPGCAAPRKLPLPLAARSASGDCVCAHLHIPGRAAAAEGPRVGGGEA